MEAVGIPYRVYLPDGSTAVKYTLSATADWAVAHLEWRDKSWQVKFVMDRRIDEGTVATAERITDAAQD